MSNLLSLETAHSHTQTNRLPEHNAKGLPDELSKPSHNLMAFTRLLSQAQLWYVRERERERDRERERERERGREREGGRGRERERERY